LIEAIFH